MVGTDRDDDDEYRYGYDADGEPSRVAGEISSSHAPGPHRRRLGIVPAQSPLTTIPSPSSHSWWTSRTLDPRTRARRSNRRSSVRRIVTCIRTPRHPTCTSASRRCARRLSGTASSIGTFGRTFLRGDRAPRRRGRRRSPSRSPRFSTPEFRWVINGAGGARRSGATRARRRRRDPSGASSTTTPPGTTSTTWTTRTINRRSCPAPRRSSWRTTLTSSRGCSDGGTWRWRSPTRTDPRTATTPQITAKISSTLTSSCRSCVRWRRWRGTDRRGRTRERRAKTRTVRRRRRGEEGAKRAVEGRVWTTSGQWTRC